jgi:palmitoyltransferase ZDHHC9/14/18
MNLPTTTISSELGNSPLDKTQTNRDSPFSQKNIQQCRCGTQNCRGVLGPKPKKPVEDRSLTSAIVAGTKRKFQDIMGSMTKRAKSENTQTSPKKRKLCAGNSAITKSKNAGVHSESTRNRAERDAAEHSRQIASRQTRALKRSTPTASSRHQNLKNPRKQLPSIRSTRVTKVSFQRKLQKPGALKSIKQSSRSRVIPQNTRTASGTSKRSQHPKCPSTPTRSSRISQSGSDGDNSPNITPASLRSASNNLRRGFEAGYSKGTGRTLRDPALRTYANGAPRS